MLPAKNRLNLSFYRIRTGKVKRGELVDIFIYPAEEFRAAVKVTKKVASKAVDRNRIRRLVSEALKPYTNKLKANIIVVAKKNFANLKSVDVKLQIADLLDN